MKIKRHNKILEIIEKYNIETQEELIEKLSLAGYEVTQATISRDIRELKLLKVMSDGGSYRYVVPGSGHGDTNHVYSKVIDGSVRSVDFALNNVVIRTYPGMANAVAARIDLLRDSDILGSVAGDDCIIIVTRSTAGAEAFAQRLRNMMES